MFKKLFKRKHSYEIIKSHFLSERDIELNESILNLDSDSFFKELRDIFKSF